MSDFAYCATLGATLTVIALPWVLGGAKAGAATVGAILLWLAGLALCAGFVGAVGACLLWALT